MTFDDTGTEVGHLTYRIGLYLGLRILHHHTAVLVVGIGNGKGVLAQSVKKRLFGITVVLEGLMVVQMVACQVGKQSSSKGQATDALLGNGMTATLHEGVFTAGIHHLGQQFVELDRVWSSMVSGNSLVLDIVADR